MEPYQIALAAITFGAAIVNGALGYGFSSLTVPLALLFLTNRVLNPALIPLEVALNAYVLWVNRDAMPNVWRRVMPIVIGLAPGVALGTMMVSQVNPAWLKFGTFIVLLPLIMIQAAGFRRPIKSEKSVGLAFGSGVGVLYSVTTISGPPLAVMLSNQGFTKQDFRAALGLIRLAESSLTAAAYFYAGLYTVESFGLIPYILPSIIIGVPIGAFLIRHIRAEVFRRTQARDRGQAARFVFITGAAGAAGEADFLRAAGRPVLEKPFAMAELWRAVGAVVGAPVGESA